MHIPRLMIAAPQGRSGKTIVTIGLCAALVKRGLGVKPFKKGPDYIDPSWLAAASIESCTNLDPFMFTESAIMQAFQSDCTGRDIALVEGSMGFYDTSEEEGRGSSAWLARLLGTPVIMVVNASRMARSAAALVRGYQDFESDTNIAGVILNNVSGARHEDKLVKAIESHCGIPVLGAIPRSDDLKIHERHLGITPFPEQEEAAGVIEQIRSVIESHVDLDKILVLASSAGRLVVARSQVTKQSYIPPQARIGVLRDKAFSFYYPHNLQALQLAGAELVFIDSLHGHLEGEINGLYIGGGFPELYARELEANTVLRHSIARLVEHGLPIYAECAGMMYLCRSVVVKGERYEMAGVFDCDTVIEGRPQGHGYMEVEVTGNSPFFAKNMVIRGHEFHHSRLSDLSGIHFAYSVKRGHGINGSHDGIVCRNVMASYLHIHALAVPGWAPNFVKLCAGHKINLLKTLV